MNIKLLRSIHLYLGCFFTPLLLFFIITGCLQTYQYHRTMKDGSYVAPAILQSFAEVHQHQKWKSKHKSPSSKVFKSLILLMSIGITVTTILGVVMAFKYTKPWLVWLCLFAGFLIPAILISMTVFYK